VKTHTDSIYRKLAVSSRSAAVERLEALGLCQRPPVWLAPAAG
jgi:ATP/maltotriose-dependent transcriptional regulator MalT